MTQRSCMAQEHFLRCSVNMLALTISSEDKDSNGPCFLGPWTTEPVNSCLPSCLGPGTSVPLTCRPPLLTHGSGSRGPREGSKLLPGDTLPCGRPCAVWHIHYSVSPQVEKKPSRSSYCVIHDGNPCFTRLSQRRIEQRRDKSRDSLPKSNAAQSRLLPHSPNALCVSRGFC